MSAEFYCTRVQTALEQFYRDNPQIGASHGLSHVMAVHEHATKAIESHNQTSHDDSDDSDERRKQQQQRQPILANLSDTTAMEIRVAAMLHDADDRKFFPTKEKEEEPPTLTRSTNLPNLPNAIRISQSADIPSESISRILKMITWVGCSENGNSIPPEIESSKDYHLLIPRWSDRLEAVGRRGVVRCYQYNRETGAPLSKDDDLYDSPRPMSEEEIWKVATPERFQMYLNNGKHHGGKKEGNSDAEGDHANNSSSISSMISHYYDKLLHIARPPPKIVRNKYLEDMANESSKELVQVCLRFGKSGLVDEGYIRSLEKEV